MYSKPCEKVGILYCTHHDEKPNGSVITYPKNLPGHNWLCPAWYDKGIGTNVHHSPLFIVSA